jgi:hypothetical protein
MVPRQAFGAPPHLGFDQAKLKRDVMKFFAICLLTLATVTAGCSSVSRMAQTVGESGSDETIRVTTETPTSAQPIFKSGQAIRVMVADTKDARPASTPNKIGRIKATVSDMFGNEVVIDPSVSQLTGGALRKQLTADGFNLVSAGQAHDFELTTVVRAFELNIVGRDELSLMLDVSLREVGSGEVIWSGTVSEKSDRFAGVMGNDRASIASYLSSGVSSLAQKVGASVRASLVQSYPQSISVASEVPKAFTLPGVTTLQAANAREGTAPLSQVTPPVVNSSTAALASNLPGAAPLPPEPAKPAPAKPSSILSDVLPGYGYFLVNTNPSRVKVYSDGIYYGLTPLKVMVPVGVMTFEFRFDGYKTTTEKISVRNGETTELELKLKK